MLSVGIGDVVECLLKGGIVLLPTDTVYGLAVSPNHPTSVEKVYLLKDRPKSLNLPIMVSSTSDLKSLGVEVNIYAKRLLESRFVPGALTLALGFHGKPLVSWLIEREEVAVRIPDSQFLLSVLRQTGPLLVTSANKHGSPPAASLAETLTQLNGQPDMTFDGGLLHTTPSTLINCRLNPPVIERLGIISETELRKVIDGDE